MAMRLDIRRQLIARGWTEDDKQFGVLRKNRAVWGTTPGGGSSLDTPRRGRDKGTTTIDFPSDCPAAVVVAAAEAAAR